VRVSIFSKFDKPARDSEKPDASGPRPAFTRKDADITSQRDRRTIWLGWLALVVLAHVSPIYGDVLAPGWEGVPVRLRVANLNQYPEFMLLFVDGQGWRQVPDSGMPVSGSFGGTFYALRRDEFIPEEVGPGEEAERDYFGNHPRLIRSGTEVQTHFTVRTGDPTEGLEHVLRITRLTDETLSLEHTTDVVTLRNGRKVEKPVAGKERQLPRIGYGHNTGRCIRIQNMADYPDYTFLMRFTWGYTIMKSGRNVMFGRVYVVKKAGFDPGEIPYSYAEAWNYYVDNRKLTSVPFRLSIEPSLDRRWGIAGITDVYAIDGISDSEVRFHPVFVEYTNTAGRVSQIPAADAVYDSRPEPLRGKPDSILSRRYTGWTLYAHIVNLDSFPDLVFLRGWPRSRQVLNSRDTFEFEPETICVARKSEFVAGQLGTQKQRAAFMQAVGAVRVDLDLSKCPFGLLREKTKICNFRLSRDGSERVRSKLVRVISVKEDGSSEVFEISNRDRVNGTAIGDAHHSTSPRGSPPQRASAVRAKGLTGWFGWIWFAGVPLLALAGIASVQFRRKSPPPGA
jgi:hypothetical protein